MQATLSVEVGHIITAAQTLNGERAGLAGQVVDVGRRARSWEEFKDACKEAEKAWKEQSGETRLPQPYANAKSITLYAMRNGIALAQRGRSVAFNALRDKVREHRNASREEQSPETSAFAEAIGRVRAARNPLLTFAASQAIASVVESFERSRERVEATLSGRSAPAATKRRAEPQVAAVAH